MKTFFAAAICGLFLTLPASSQDSDRESFGAEARTEMGRLAPLAGEWVVTVNLYSAETGQWSVMGEERVQIRYMLDGLALREDAPERPANIFRLESTLQYDQYRDVYRLAAMDDTWGNMDIYEGGWTADGTLVLDNMRAGTSFVSADGTPSYFRLTTRIIDTDHNQFTVEMSTDNGENWVPYQRLDRARFGRSGAH